MFVIEKKVKVEKADKHKHKGGKRKDAKVGKGKAKVEKGEKVPKATKMKLKSPKEKLGKEKSVDFAPGLDADPDRQAGDEAHGSDNENRAEDFFDEEPFRRNLGYAAGGAGGAAMNIPHL